jgi:hypothetical protein
LSPELEDGVRRALAEVRVVHGATADAATLQDAYREIFGRAPAAVGEQRASSRAAIDPPAPVPTTTASTSRLTSASKSRPLTMTPRELTASLRPVASRTGPRSPTSSTCVGRGSNP